VRFGAVRSDSRGFQIGQHWQKLGVISIILITFFGEFSKGILLNPWHIFQYLILHFCITQFCCPLILLQKYHSFNSHRFYIETHKLFCTTEFQLNYQTNLAAAKLKLLIKKVAFYSLVYL